MKCKRQAPLGSATHHELAGSPPVAGCYLGSRKHTFRHRPCPPEHEICFVGTRGRSHPAQAATGYIERTRQEFNCFKSCTSSWGHIAEMEAADPNQE